MYSSGNENELIVTDIVDVLQDYVSIQIDIDETKVKAASIVAQKIDITRVIGKENVDRCIDPQDESDEQLRDLLIPALCYFTYTRCLRMFQGTFTDSGFTIETEATDKNISKSVALEMSSIADAFMADVIEFLEEEGADDGIEMKEKLSPKIRSFGGKEIRASN